MAQTSTLSKLKSFFKTPVQEKTTLTSPILNYGIQQKELNPYYGVVGGAHYAATGMPWLSSDARKAVLTEWFWQPIRGQPRRVDTNELRKYSNTIWVQSIVMTVLNQISSIPWDVVPKKGKEQDDLKEQIETAKEFLECPNKNEESLNDLIRAWIKDVLEIDAGVLVKVFTPDSYDFENLEPRSGAPLLKPLVCPYCSGEGTGEIKHFKQHAQKALESITKAETLPDKYIKKFSNEGKNSQKTYNLIKQDYSKIKTKLRQVVSYNSPNEANVMNYPTQTSMTCPYCNGTKEGRHLQEIYARDGSSFLKDADRTGWTYGYWQYCMTKNNFVETSSGVKLISEISEGDFVLGHDGKWHKVIETYSRIYEGNFIKIKAQGMPLIECTKEHPFLIKRNKKEKWVNAEDITQDDMLIAISESEKEKTKTLSFFEPTSYEAKQKRKFEKTLKLRKQTGKGCKSLKEEIGASSATINSWIQGKSAPKCSVIPWTLKLDKELSELFGWYVAEGCVTRGNTINFTLAYTEGENAERIQFLMQKYFGLKCSSFRQDNVIQLRFFNKVLAGWLSKTFYKGKNKNARTKSIPRFLMLANKEIQKSFLNAYISGDGFYNFSGASMTTASKTLAFDLRRMFIRLNVYPSLSYSPPRTHEFKGRIISSNGFWQVILNTNAMKNIILGKPNNPDLKQKTKQSGFGKFFVPIQKIEKETKIERVYNFHVSKVNNYTANGFVTHNSYAIPAHPMWFNRDEIIYFNQTTRSMSVYGYSAVQSSLEVIKSLEYSVKHNMSLFLDGAVPDGVISTEDMSNEEMKRMKTSWENELKGQPHKVIFINKKQTLFHSLLTTETCSILKDKKHLGYN